MDQQRRRVVILLVFLAIIAAMIWSFRAVLAPFLVAIFAAYLLDPVVERMAPLHLFGRIRLGRGGSIIIIYVIFLVTVYIGGMFAVPALVEQIKDMRDDLPKLRSWVDERAPDWERKWKEWIGQGADVDEDAQSGPPRSRFHLKPRGEIAAEIVARDEEQIVLRLGGKYEVLDRGRVDYEEPLSGSHGFDVQQLFRRGIDQVVHNLNSILEAAFRFARTMVGIFSMLVLVMMITAFLVIDREAIVRFIYSVPPEQHRATYENLRHYIDRGLAGVIRGQLTICTVNGILTWLGLQVLGVRYTMLLGLIAGVFSLIPVFGTILSTVPIVLIAWGAGTLNTGLLALGWILLIHFIEANYLNPRIMGTASKIHPVVIFFALVAGQNAYGVVGALLAVPAASIVQSCFKFYVLDRQLEIPPETETAPGQTLTPGPSRS